MRLNRFVLPTLFVALPLQAFGEEKPRQKTRLKRVIQLKRGSGEKAESLIKSFKTQKILKIVGGKYDKSFHDFVNPKSMHGQLLQMGWQAVPSLLDALNEKKMSRRKKAWVLSLLYSISQEDEFDPTKLFGSFPDYEYKYSGTGGVRVKGHVLGGDGIYEKPQQKLIARWMNFKKDYLDIREAKR